MEEWSFVDDKELQAAGRAPAFASPANTSPMGWTSTVGRFLDAT